jgi:hypothetical protein
MFVIILAVTKAYDGFCIAGLNEIGQWVRPVPNDQIRIDDPNSRFWSREQLMISGEFVKSGDVWEIEGRNPARLLYPNHVEDYVINKYRFSNRLTNNQLMQFLRTKAEKRTAFNDTILGQGRSLCLVKVDSFETEIFTYNGISDSKIYLTSKDFCLDNPHVRFSNYKLKDCKWAGLVMQSHRLPHFSEVYAAIGLATQFRGTDYPQIIGLHTNPNMPFPETYPDS